jgi:hypothetical protein
VGHRHVRDLEEAGHAISAASVRRLPELDVLGAELSGSHDRANSQVSREGLVLSQICVECESVVGIEG